MPNHAQKRIVKIPVAKAIYGKHPEGRFGVCTRPFSPLLKQGAKMSRLKPANQKTSAPQNSSACFSRLSLCPLL